ncbi:dihydroflavonol 4-reductase-like [Apium graveolens]|uniref:dihydroflavonol 4-reductase-like n=1 Tax=Apium graveolens TaxID=4045 RepID=UPI003D79FB0A
MEGKRTVCVTGASGYIGSWLVMRLLERRYHVRATVRDPDLVFLNSVLKLLPSTSGNEKKVKHLSELPNANTHLTLWKADLAEESSYDDAFHGCEGVFHMASPMELLVHDQATVYIRPLLSVLFLLCQIMKKTFLRINIKFDQLQKYLAEKTVAEKAAWKYAEENGIDMVTVHPSLVFGHFITPYTGYSIDIAISYILWEGFRLLVVEGVSGAMLGGLSIVGGAAVFVLTELQGGLPYVGVEGVAGSVLGGLPVVGVEGVSGAMLGGLSSLGGLP